MSIRTVEELNQRLDDDLSWRKKELTAILALVQTNESHHTRRNTMLRCAIALLYAHWEGFIKNASCSYLEFVSRRQLSYRSLSSNFLALALFEKYPPNVSNSLRSYLEITDFFVNERDSRSSIPYKNTVNTKSNLSSATFKDIVDSLGLDYTLYASKEKLIDDVLLKSRNSIAHGDYLSIDEKEYRSLHTTIIEMIALFKNQICNSAINKNYAVVDQQQSN